MILLGCIADDFTGASDAASFLAKGGMRVRLHNGIPAQPLPEDDHAQAAVIALKSRTQETKQAVADSLHAARYLLAQGAEQLYFKYCSTFDSTPQGNIGPVADALMELLNVPYTLLCPALPVNGRTVESGKLMVNGMPLDKSHMRNHPLTPMWDARVSRLMKPQSRYECVGINIDKPYQIPNRRCYLIPDYRTDQDGEKIAAIFGEQRLLTGGSGLLEPLARIWSGKRPAAGSVPPSATKGKCLILAGSCSQATLAQIAYYQKLGLPAYKLDPESMLNGTQTAADARRFIEEHELNSDAVLIYSSDTPENVRKFQGNGVELVSEMLEQTTAEIAVWAVSSGYTRIICAGGETSGAITKALDFSSYWIGQSIAAGVPVMVPTEHPNLRLVLKSGNFGQEDFFIKALNMTSNCLDEKHNNGSMDITG